MQVNNKKKVTDVAYISLLQAMHNKVSVTDLQLITGD